MASLVAEKVKELRARRMLTQAELAEMAGVSEFTVQRIERGEGGVRAKTGREIARALNVDVEALLPKAEPAPVDEWSIALAGARGLREDGREIVERALEAWRESRDRGESPADRREHLERIGALLQAAINAENALHKAGASGATNAPNTDDFIEELIKASHFSGEIRGRVEAAGIQVVRGERGPLVKELAA